MMRKLFFLLLFFPLYSVLPGQDLIIKITDEEIIADVLEIKNNKVLFLPYNDPEQKVQKLPKRKIQMILFEDGMKQFFQVEKYQEFNNITGNNAQTYYRDSSLSMYELGVADAKMHYHKPGPMWGTFGATAFYPAGGIFTGAFTGIIIGAVPPSIDLSSVPNPELFRSNLDYVQGYQRQARKMKVLDTVKGFGLGMGIQVIWLLVISSL